LDNDSIYDSLAVLLLRKGPTSKIKLLELLFNTFHQPNAISHSQAIKRLYKHWLCQDLLYFPDSRFI